MFWNRYNTPVSQVRHRNRNTVSQRVGRVNPELLISNTASQGEPARHALGGSATLFGEAGPVAAPGEADVAVLRDNVGRVWAVLSPEVSRRARASGRPALGRMVELSAGALCLDGRTYEVIRSAGGVRVSVAGQDTQCPVCHLLISAGDEILACACGLLACSRFCASGGGRTETCLRCGQSLPTKEATPREHSGA